MPVKTLLFLVFVLLVGISNAQQKVVTITDSLFDTPSRYLNLSEMDGWYFRQGHNESWGAQDISLNGWKKMGPAEFSALYADKNGKAEVWFRIMTHIDSNIQNLPSGIMSPTWAASDVYINGKLTLSFGQTGKHGTTYQQNRHYQKEPMPVEFKPGKDYTIAVHVVDYIVPVLTLWLIGES